MLKFTCCNALQRLMQGADAQILRGITRGFEREGLRVDASGQITRSSHPAALGSKLTHPWITTDYAEALLEFITPPSQDPEFPLATLRDIHRYSVQHLGDELLWAGSMPCRLGPDADIQIAHYGSSHAARFKQVYREGLGLRYGRSMQTIAGAHYNWSLPDVFWQVLQDCCPVADAGADLISERYFGLIRNFLRFGWIIPYLFGASPALCSSFLHGHPSDLQELGSGTLYGPYATSLRMSDLGYQNRAQAQLNVSFNSLQAYTRGLEDAIRTPDPYYAQIGVREGSRWKQISASLLQLEAEFYAAMRPKRIAVERPALALRKYGVQYVEMRLFDLNPYVDIGIAAEQARFVDALLLLCVFRESPPITSREEAENTENKRRVVRRGRQPGLQLLVHNREQALSTLAHELFDDLQPFAEVLDAAYGVRDYAKTLLNLRERVAHPDLTPSARVLEGVREAGGHLQFTMDLSQQHTRALQAAVPEPAMQERFAASVAQSWVDQARLEAAETGSFEEYVQAYFAQ